MRKIIKKIVAFSLTAAMVVQPLAGNFLNLSPKTASAAPITNTATIPAPQSRLDAAKSNASWQVGAKMPYFRYDTSPAKVGNSYTHNTTNIVAMDANAVSYQDNYTGTKKESTDWNPKNIATQASNQSYVELAKGQSVTFKMVNGHGGDGVTVRYTLPDGNGGTKDSAGKPIGNVSDFSVSTSNSAAVLGYDNEDTSRRYNTYMTGNKVKVTSDYAWQWFGYDSYKKIPTGGHPQDAPGDGVGAFAFDEVHFRLDKALDTGDTITITNSGSYTLGIDFIEVEKTQKIAAPSGAVIVPAGTTLNNESIKSYITKAEASSSKTLYFAPGVHYFSGKWIVSGYKIRIMGAGIWYTKLQFTNSDRNNDNPTTGGGIMGDKGGYANGMEFCHMYINSNLHSRYDQQANYKCFSDLFQNNTKIHDIWEEHFECGFWMGKYVNNASLAMDGVQIYNCRIRNNYADGINFCQGTKNSAAYNNNSRNNGDDGLAMWNATDFQPDDEYNNTFCYNTVEFIWRAGGIAVYGGDGHKVYNNYVRDTFMASGIHLNDHFPGHKYNNTKKITIENNVLLRTGTNGGTWGEQFGAIDILDGVKNVAFNNNEVYDSPFDVMQLKCSGSGVTFNNTVIFGVGISNVRSYQGTNDHSGAIVYQQDANIPFTNLIAKNVPNKNNTDSADKHWPYFCDGTPSNLPTLPSNEIKVGNTNYSFTIDGNGNYAYSGGTYTMNSNSNSFPGYDYNSGKNLVADGDTPVETLPPETTVEQGGNPDETYPTEAPTEKPFGPGVGDVELTDFEGTYSWDTGYKWQKNATVSDTISSSMKYLVVTYTGDITSMRLGDNANPPTAVYWFNPTQKDDGTNKPFVTVAGTSASDSTTKNTIVIDLAATGASPSFFTSFHVHTGATGAAGTVDITQAWLTDTIPTMPGEEETTKQEPTVQPTTPEPTTKEPVTPEPTTKEPVTEQPTTKPQEPTTQAPVQSGYDLTVEGLAWANDSGSTELKEGDAVTYSVLIKNNSSVDIPAGTVIGFKAVVDGKATVSNQTFGNGLKAGETAKLAATSKWTAVYGGHTVEATVDDTNKLPNEADETNNTITKSFNVARKSATVTKVTGGYDLFVTDIEYDKNAVAAGDRLVFTATVTNAGDTDIAAGTVIGYQLQVDGNTSDIRWCDTYSSGLKAGESVRLTCNSGSTGVNYWTAAEGTHTITAWVDDVNRIQGEVNENNNMTSITLSVPNMGLIENPDSPDDLDNIVDDPTKINISNRVKIEGYQMSTTLEGSRVVGSVEPTINNKEVKNWGFIYAVTKAGDETFGVADTDMYVGSTSKYVTSLESTPIGTAEDVKFGSSDTATYFVRTTLFGPKTAKEFSAEYKVRAYAQLSDGSYVYSAVSSYSVYDIADMLYTNKMMNTVTAHNYLYNTILKVVNPNYKENDYNWGSVVVDPSVF